MASPFIQTHRTGKPLWHPWKRLGHNNLMAGEKPLQIRLKWSKMWIPDTLQINPNHPNEKKSNSNIFHYKASSYGVPTWYLYGPSPISGMWHEAVPCLGDEEVRERWQEHIEDREKRPSENSKTHAIQNPYESVCYVFSYSVLYHVLTG